MGNEFKQNPEYIFARGFTKRLNKKELTWKLYKSWARSQSDDSYRLLYFAIVGELKLLDRARAAATLGKLCIVASNGFSHSCDWITNEPNWQRSAHWVIEPFGGEGFNDQATGVEKLYDLATRSIIAIANDLAVEATLRFFRGINLGDRDLYDLKKLWRGPPWAINAAQSRRELLHKLFPKRTKSFLARLAGKDFNELPGRLPKPELRKLVQYLATHDEYHIYSSQRG